MEGVSKRVLVIGKGGREHAFAWKIAQSKQVVMVYVAPGNAGTCSQWNKEFSGKIDNVASLDVTSCDAITAFCHVKRIDIVIIGPEDPLANGMADGLRKAGILVFGPSADAARIESSKAFSKSFMKRHNIPTADFRLFKDYSEATAYVKSSTSPFVIKVSGLAAGKGVFLPNSVEEAESVLKEIMVEKKFGDAGDDVVIEERLMGEEVSVLAFTDGFSVSLCPPAQDHKRIHNNDQGPNTGGMGAYAPAPLASPELMDQIRDSVMLPAISGLRREGCPFVGILYAGIMVSDSADASQSISVLEFNCRMGDPEAQCILPLLKTDLFDVVSACCNHCLDSVNVEFTNFACVNVVLASEGYPGPYVKGVELQIKDKGDDENSIVFHCGTSVTADNLYFTDGGRVISVSCVGEDIEQAVESVYKFLANLRFKGMQFRNDIGQKGISRLSSTKVQSMSYKDSGVDITAGNEAVKLMKSAVEATHSPAVLAGLGSFGGLYSAMELKAMKSPVLVSSADGVGTKIKVAAALQIYDTIGQDIVNHCINDILVQGAKPLFFLDYIASSKIDPVMVATVVQGIAFACSKEKCALIGGETAEMPGVYVLGEFDLAGTIVGVVERANIIDGSSIVPGDVVLSIASAGLHTNGFSLARKVFEGCNLSDTPDELGGESIGQALLKPHRCYLKEISALLDAGIVIKGLVHVTGGGLIENPPRILPANTTMEISRGSWNVLPIFEMIQKRGNVDDMEMARVFNMGIGMLVVLSESDASKAMSILNSKDVSKVGQIIERSHSPVTFCGRTSFLSSLHHRKLRLAVLGSTRGTDMTAICDAIQSGRLNASIEIVISNKKNAFILERAKSCGIRAIHVAVNKRTREAYDEEISSILKEHNIDLVLLIGYMRIISGPFVDQWRNKILNVHPSLLPAFAGGMDMNVHQAVIDARVSETGCTVHFVDEGVDSGFVVCQKSCSVDSDETADSLKQKVQRLEGEAFIESIQAFIDNSIQVPYSQ